MITFDPAPVSRRPRWVVPAVAAGVVLAVVAVAGALAGGPGGTIPGAAVFAAASAKPNTAPGEWVGPNGGMPGPGHGWGRGHGMAMGQITITAISGSDLSLKTTDGWTRTIDATGATITRAGQTVQLGALKVGDQIVFRETRQSDGTFKITAIQVVLPHVAGSVTAVTGSTVTLRLQDGSSKTVQLTGSTTYRLGGQSASKSALVVGTEAEIEGTQASDGTFTASLVEVEPAVVRGTVTAKSASTITVNAADGGTITVKVGSGTVYRVAGKSSATLADVAVGNVIAAQGTRNADGSFSATTVLAGAAGSWGPGLGLGHMFGPGGMKGMGGMGWGRGPLDGGAPAQGGSTSDSNGA